MKTSIKLVIITIAIFMSISGCAIKQTYTPMDHQTLKFMTVTRSSTNQNKAVVRRLVGSQMDSLFKNIQTSGKHIAPKGTYNCQAIRDDRWIYFVNVYFTNNQVRTFSTTGICDMLYDSKDHVSLQGSVPNQLEKLFK